MAADMTLPARTLGGYIKHALSFAPYSERLETAIRLPLLRRFRTRGANVDTREALYRAVYKDCDQPLTYLEFGVHRGASMRRWVEMDTHPLSRFHGFDSFEGLPETWVNGSKTLAAGHFSTDGALPAITDSRVTFHKGWFQQTLPGFLKTFQPTGQLVVHCDADLYSSTLFVLCSLHPYLVPGALIVFDDFSSMLHEFRAWHDYTSAFQQQGEVVATSHGRSYLKHVAIRVS